jgi:hypothetical protein
MATAHDTTLILDALQSISPDLSREEWVRVGMAAHASGLTHEEFDTWSAPAGSYNAAECLSTWRSFKLNKGIGAGTLFKIAKEHGWRSSGIAPQKQRQTLANAHTQKKHPTTTEVPRAGMSVYEVWERCEPATNSHPYIQKKKAAGVSLDGLRVVPKDDGLIIQGERMAGSLVVPMVRPDGTFSSLQFITPQDITERLLAKGKSGKLNLPKHDIQGWFTVGELVSGQIVYVCEGIGQACACWQATGQTAVVCFGWGRVRAVATELSQRDPSLRLVLVPDVGKEADAYKIALEVGAAVASMPEGWPRNSDVNDLMQSDGGDVLELLLEGAKQPPKPVPRYKLLSSSDLELLPPLAWRIRGVLPATGLAALFGQSASGKSFLGLDMATAIAEGRSWFGCRVEAASVIYVALEGEAGFKLRVRAWETYTGRKLPINLKIVMQPFKLTEQIDVNDLADVVPKGAVVFLDTLNRAAPTADENSSKDMGEILEAAKRLQSLICGLIVLIHHSGKDMSKGLRGHSSLFAAMDAVLEVSRNGDIREWKISKAKDGDDGMTRQFMLQVEALGTDSFGDVTSSCVVVQEHTSRDVQAVKLPQGGNQRLVYEGIRGLFKDGATGLVGAPPFRPCIELEIAITAGANRLSCEKHRRVSRSRDAITGLVTRGVLGLNDGWLWIAN